MKTSNIAKTLTIAAITAFVLGIAPRAKADDKGCTLADLKGTFIYTSTGTIIANAPPAILGPAAEVGRMEFDGEGDIKFIFNASQNGILGSGILKGTYKVNEDCTGTFTEIYPLTETTTFTANFSFVIDRSRGEFQAICQDPGVVDTRSGRRQWDYRRW